jgi:hypothetical protein
MKISTEPVGKKAQICNESPEKGPEELGNDGCADSVGFMRGLNPTPPAELSFSTACETPVPSGIFDLKLKCH